MRGFEPAWISGFLDFKLKNDCSQSSFKNKLKTRGVCIIVMSGGYDHDWDNQAFFVLNNESHDRMLGNLKSGSPYEKCFKSVCPHKNKLDCKCKYHINFLFKCKCHSSCSCKFDNDSIVRCVNGKLKVVMAEREYKQILHKYKIQYEDVFIPHKK